MIECILDRPTVTSSKNLVIFHWIWAVLKPFAITVPCPRSSQDAAPVEATETLRKPARVRLLGLTTCGQSTYRSPLKLLASLPQQLALAKSAEPPQAALGSCGSCFGFGFTAGFCAPHDRCCPARVRVTQNARRLPGTGSRLIKPSASN